MADENEDIQLELEDLPKPDDDLIIEGEAPKEGKRVIEPEEGLEALKAKLQAEQEHLAREKSAHADTQRREQEAAAAAVSAINEVHDTNITLVTNAIDTIEQSNAILKSNYSLALSNQDFDGAADIQMEMTRNAAKLEQLNTGKQALEQQPKAQTPQTRQSDPVEQMASQLSPRSASWLRAHPEFASNEGRRNEMIGAHYKAIGKGFTADSDAYFNHVEQELGVGRQADITMDDAMSESAKPTGGRSAAPAAAPVSRSPGGPGTNPTTVRLSAAEREMAEAMKMTPQEYAREKLKLQREGTQH